MVQHEIEEIQGVDLEFSISSFSLLSVLWANLLLFLCITLLLCKTTVAVIQLFNEHF